MIAYDPEISAAINELRSISAPLPPLPVGDIAGRRARLEAGYLARSAAAGEPDPELVAVEDHEFAAEDGEIIAVRVYRPRGVSFGPALLYLHGGGMFCCSIATHDAVCRRYAVGGTVTVIAPAYRLAPEHGGETPVRDATKALTWVTDNSDELGIDPSRLAIGGDSAGGGLAVGATLLARAEDRALPSAMFLLYPMLDDRTSFTADPEIDQLVTWTRDDTITGWAALLGARLGTDDVSPFEAPARESDLRGLPRMYLDVGQIDVFRDEALALVQAAARDGVPTEFHLRAGANHVFELYAPLSAVAMSSMRDRYAFLQTL